MVAPHSTAMALHCPVVARGASNLQCIMGVHDSESQDELIGDISDGHSVGATPESV